MTGSTIVGRVFAGGLTALALIGLQGCSSTSSGAGVRAVDASARTRAFTLSELAQAPRRKVVAQLSDAGGGSLRVTLEPGLAESEMIDNPTFVIVPVTLTNGVVEVEVLSRVLQGAPELARGFAGLAYRISPDADRFESVYLRPMNGRGLAPPPPRERRAIQYFAYPDWTFDRLREVHPDGSFEAGADIGPDKWITLRLEIAGRRVTAFVDGQKTLEVEGKVDPAAGAVGLWVDIGTEAFFRNLRVTAE